ncbi:MAG TPA: response regulator transcription factor [Roseiflexaceae bacterium]|nr:response regulator transcription factor [Roseiflexaceae bacterium]HMP38976.1 response regulator transcription factor [Roseiflexaceae bacterium]
MSATPIRVLIVDDHTLFREGLIAIMANAQDLVVVGETGIGTDAITMLHELQPDVVLMDINMPGSNGIVVTRQILAQQPAIGVIMLTMLEDDESLFAAMCAGARGYILKGARKSEVLRTIRAVAAGEALFGPAIAARVTALFQQQSVAPYQAAIAFPDLTEREREVLELIAQGASNQVIARQLSISAKTVSNYISIIFSKLQVIDRAQAIVKARRAGFGDRA